jgi:hypothetical protein
VCSNLLANRLVKITDAENDKYNGATGKDNLTEKFTKKLEDKEIEYVNLLQFNYKNKNKLKIALNEYFKNTKNLLYSAFMSVLRVIYLEQNASEK